MLPPRLLSLAAWVGVSSAQLRVHDASFVPDLVLEVTQQDAVINCEVRHSAVVNGTVPGPPIYLREGHTTWIRVWNRMADENLTMHWHGLSQRAAPFSDGTPLVSQHPTPPEHFFDYELRPEIGDAGSYFYHSHKGLEMSTAHGALIVLDAAAPPHVYDGDLTMLLADYYNKTDDVIGQGLLADPFRWSGEPQAVTVQGSSGRVGFGAAKDPSCAPHVWDVEPGKVYRVRVIGATMLSLVKAAFEDHGAEALRVIEADGADARPVAVDHIQVASGQRFSFLLRTKSEVDIRASGKTQYWVRYETKGRPQSITGYALLRYKVELGGVGAKLGRLLGLGGGGGGGGGGELPPSLPGQPPMVLDDETTTYLEYQLHPLLDSERAEFPRLSEVTRRVVIQVNQQLETGSFVDGKLNGSLVWAENGFAWRENVQADAHQMPYLVNVYLKDGQPDPDYALALQHGGFDPVTKTFPVRIGEVLEIVWLSNSGPTGGFDNHPMHVHGWHVYDAGAGAGVYDAEANERNFETEVPLRRDTTNLYKYRQRGAANTTSGWRAWRIRVTEKNIGAWMMHCHISQHSFMGMNTVWVYGTPEDMRRKFPAPPYVQGYLEYGGSAYGRKGRDPEVMHFWDDKGRPQGGMMGG